MAKIYRTVIRYEIISEEPICETTHSLEDIAYNCNEGSWSGRFLDAEKADEELTGIEAVNVIKAQGSDPEFFMMDENGIDLVISE